MKLLAHTPFIAMAGILIGGAMSQGFSSDEVARREMNMDMMNDGGDDDGGSGTSTVDVDMSEMTPVPHVMNMHHGVPILQTKLEPEEQLFWDSYNTTTYFNVESKHRGSLYAHIVLTLTAFVFVYPIYLVLCNVGSNWQLPLLAVHSGMVMIGLMCFSVFMGSIGDLYPHNAYNTMSWLLFISTGLQLFFSLISSGYKYVKDDGANYFSISDEETCASHAITLSDLSRGSPSLEDAEHEQDHDQEHHDDFRMKTSNDAMFTPYKNPLRKIYSIGSVRYLIDHLGKSAGACLAILNWGHFFYFLIYMPTGIATFLVLGEGSTVFNLLAHFIKGGIFFAYGILSLARYCGAFTNKGWAWNHKFITKNTSSQSLWNKIQSRGMITMEMIESSLILFYGCTNIFLEHLAGAGQAYSAKDLQHASIAFIYIGCGLSGVITEIKLSSWRFEKSIENYERQTSSNSSKNIIKGSPGFSPNPFPLVTIYWTGILMSKHEQASELSTDIHVQWGNLFVMGCAFRFLTYILVLLLPANKRLNQPSRPMTELIVSFCLLCGGMIFMESTDPVVLAFEYHGYTAMLTLNVSLGVVMLIMGWEMFVFAFKDWLIKRRS